MKTVLFAILSVVLMNTSSSSAQTLDKNSAEVQETDSVYQKVDQEPKYPNGQSQLAQDISRNFKYTQVAITQGIEGTLILRFIVEKDGSVGEVKVLRGLGFGLDEAGVEAVRKLRKFDSPAILNGEAVRYQLALPIRCQLPSK